MARLSATRFSSVLGILLATLMSLISLACSDGGGGSSVREPPSGPLAAMEQSSRFLAQATLGASMEEIERADALGFEVWLDEQIAMRPSRHSTEMDRLIATYGDPAREETEGSSLFRRLAWWNRTMSAPDVLRQRVAMALSEIFVVSELMDALAINPGTVASYYDVLIENAFGSYEDLLFDVTMHPAMGVYLSHLYNDRSDEVLGRFPDENYAREVMQLFSIGLFELDPNGEQRKDATGDPIPTYANAEITEFAKVFTGLGLQGPFADFGNGLGDRRLPMVMYEAHHEPGPKTLLNGLRLPAGQTGTSDIRDTVEHLANHPNVGPFIGRRLIQRLVKSNPSPEYIERVAAVFADDGTGERGNLGAVVRAILLDEEARRDPSDEDDGRLREPFLRFVSFFRAFGLASTSGEYLVNDVGIGFLVGQSPMASPSVFNFFRPDFAPNGPVQQAGLVAPEFQITTDASVIWIANLITGIAFEEASVTYPVDFFLDGTIDETSAELAFDLSEELAIAGDVDELLDHLDLLLTYGTLSADSRAAIREVLAAPGLEEANVRTRLAIHFILISPDYAVVR